jgi:hypothetical protein
VGERNLHFSLEDRLVGTSVIKIPLRSNIAHHEVSESLHLVFAYNEVRPRVLVSLAALLLITSAVQALPVDGRLRNNSV